MKKIKGFIVNCILILFVALIVIGGTLLFFINNDIFRAVGMLTCLSTLILIILYSTIKQDIENKDLNGTSIK